MTLDTPENTYPTSLRVTDREFDITTSIDDRKFIDAEDYLRVPEKTDHFILYKTREATRKGIEIVLHTHRTLASFQANPFQKTIAKKTRPWLYDEEILNPEALNSLRLPPSEVADHEQIKKILGYDRLTEGDSLRFFNYVAGSKLDVPSEFWPVLLLWLRDELNQHKGFHAVYQHLFGFDNELETAIASEESDFNQFDTIMSDPFKLLVALVYDEASTINGYQHDIPVYELIGAPLVKFVKRVAADEGWHFSKFADMAAKYYPDRIGEIDSILDEVTNADGRKYRRTFFLDHDPSVESQFTEEMKQRAKLIAKKSIMSKVERTIRKIS